MIWCCRFFRKIKKFVPNGLYVSDFIEYAYILLDIGSDAVLISAGGADMYPVAFSCEFLTSHGF